MYPTLLGMISKVCMLLLEERKPLALFMRLAEGQSGSDYCAQVILTLRTLFSLILSPNVKVSSETKQCLEEEIT